MPLSDLRRPWHGVPLYGWYLGGSVLAGTSVILYRRWRQAKALAAAGTTSSAPGSPDKSGPLPGWGGLGDALGPLGGSSPSGPLLGWTSDGQPVYGKGPEVTGATPPPVTTPGSVDPAPGPTSTLPPAPSPVDTLVRALPGEIAQPVEAVANKILPSLEIAAPNPTPASIPASAAPVAGMPAGTPGITQTPSGYTVPSNWLSDIAAIPSLAQAYAAPPKDIRQADWNTGKPFTVDSPVPDWQKYGFGSQEQYTNSQAQAAAATASFDPANTPGTREWYLAHPDEIRQTPFGPATAAQWELGHSQGRW